jgi:hypothetical protein
MGGALLVVTAYVALTVLAGWAYFRRYRVVRPPLGVVSLTDVAIMLTFIVLVPYLYLTLPLWAVAVVFGLAVLNAIYLTLLPLLRWRWPAASVCFGLVGADVALAVGQGVTSEAFLLVNDIILALVVVGAANLWAQSGMKARDVTILGAALAVYDVIATWQLPVMVDLLNRLSQLPLFPMIAWPIGPGEVPGAGSGDVLSHILGVGLGDILLATVFPLTMRKAFGRSAGLMAVAVTLATVVGALIALEARLVTTGIPVMTFLGPLMIVQYAYWLRARQGERTTWQYLQAEPLPRQG